MGRFGKVTGKLKIITLFFIVLFVLVGVVLYDHQKESAITEAEKRIEIFMKKWHALFYYIEVRQKEVFYDLEERGVLTKKGYFNPEVLSFTYIARQVQHKYEEIEKAKGNIPYIYRIAASTPRNPINKATPHEEQILNRFRNNEIEKFTEFTHKESVKYYTSYTPIDRTTETCMRCHSNPERAPTGLVEMYGTKAGFGESVGQVRGMVVMEIPFEEIESEAMSNFILTLITIFLIFLLFYIVLVFLIKKDEKLIESNKKLELLSNTDKLTTLANRHYFDSYLQQQWSLMKRLNKPLSLLMCDIDFFKQYNDTFGHHAGDECLIQIAQVFKNVVKRDTDLIARYGGEEFAIIIPDSSNEAATKIAKEVVEAVRSLQISHSRPDEKDIVTISIGVSTIVPTNANSTELLITSADKMLYSAKSNGRDRVQS
jgi:diguanylate cyclase (GGDEF)-like protein